jgi:hypothetical protein
VTKQGILLTHLLLVSLTISTLVFILPPVKAEPTTWTANEDSPVVFSIIQDALAAANNGDSAPIEYELSIEVSGYGITSPLLVLTFMRKEVKLLFMLLILILLMAGCLKIGFLMVQQ